MKKYYKVEIERKNFWFKAVPLFIVVSIISVILGFFIVDKKVMPRVTNLQNKGDVTIPNIVDMSVKKASDLLYNDGLFLSEDSKEYSEKPLKVILRQTPEPGKKVKAGHHVFVTISKGPEAAIIPSVLKLSEGPAKSKLRKAGFSSINSIQKYNPDVAKGNAIRTKPKAKMSTSRDGKITLYISKGPRPTHTIVPSLVGEMLSVAKAKIKDAELEVGSITYSSNSSLGAGQVIKQSAAPGANISLSTKVNLVVAAQ